MDPRKNDVNVHRNSDHAVLSTKTGGLSAGISRATLPHVGSLLICLKSALNQPAPDSTNACSTECCSLQQVAAGAA